MARVEADLRGVNAISNCDRKAATSSLLISSV